MCSESGRFTLAFNGEIYNHGDLRAELASVGAAPRWRGHSDTETLLAGFEYWGVERTLSKTVGMFAIAVWDNRESVLSLARDRFGEKPLYYGWTRGSFVFGSELKAIRAYPGFENSVNRDALAHYVRFTYVPAPLSIFTGVYKLEPGCILRVSGAAPARHPSAPLRPPARYGTVCIDRWWSLRASIESVASARFVDDKEATDALEEAIAAAVKIQSLADVPLGAFLSGGVDSSTIVSMMQAQSTVPIKTFTIGFSEAEFDEAPYARAIAAHLGTDHTEITVTPSDARDVIPQLSTMYDEPFADSSQIPTHLVCRAARGQVTVALSGDGGDELFGGYNRYLWAPWTWSRVSWLPHPVRSALGAALTSVSPEKWDSVNTALNRVRGRPAGVHRAGEKAHKLGARLRRVRSEDELYLSLVSEWQSPTDLVAHWHTPLTSTQHLLAPLPKAGTVSFSERMMYWDAVSYLPDDILCKVDRAAMAVGLETRVPLLDHRVVELAWRLPIQMKIRTGTGKWALRQVLFRHVPRNLIDRPKRGFALPLDDWLRGPLRDWAEALLDRHRLAREGFFDPTTVLAAWTGHKEHRTNCAPQLWTVLMFQSWLEAIS
jgi:asparagine synthase (glutamine-hydrolysing)